MPVSISKLKIDRAKRIFDVETEPTGSNFSLSIPGPKIQKNTNYSIQKIVSDKPSVIRSPICDISPRYIQKQIFSQTLDIVKDRKGNPDDYDM